MSELGIFIFWENARHSEETFLNEIAVTFDIVSKFYIKWSDDKLIENMSRFYNLHRRYAKKKLHHCGGGEFCVVIVRDNNPQYLDRNTLSGRRPVNANIYDKKIKFRKTNGGGHNVHASDNEDEAIANYALLLGRDLLNDNDLAKNNENVYTRDLEGSAGWSSLKAFLLVMNTHLKYVILRNFENFPNEAYIGEHADIDMLVQNRAHCVKILNATKRHRAPFREAYEVTISGVKVNLDLRTIESGYYCKSWSTALLSERIYDANKFCYHLPLLQYQHSLIYHALLHKENISDDYIEKITNLWDKTERTHFTRDELTRKLEKYMNLNRYKICEPSDFSVYFNQSKKSVRRKLYFNFFRYGSVLKRQLLK